LTTITTTTTAAGIEPSPAITAHRTVGVVSSIELIWPSFVRRAEQQVISGYLENVPLTVQQEFLDEMAVNHRSNSIQNPGGYIRRLSSLYRVGTWHPERAHLERERREKASQTLQPMNSMAQPAAPHDRSNFALARATLDAILKRPRGT